jgi:hypothetical protein
MAARPSLYLGGHPRSQVRDGSTPSVFIQTLAPKIGEFRLGREHSIDGRCRRGYDLGRRSGWMRGDPCIDGFGVRVSNAPIAFEPRHDFTGGERFARFIRTNRPGSRRDHRLKCAPHQRQIVRILQSVRPIASGIVVERVHAPCTHAIASVNAERRRRKNRRSTRTY